MPETPSVSSSSSSCVSSISFDEVPAGPGTQSDNLDSTGGDIKLLCSYGGSIIPRRHDGKLRYVGGHTRVVTVQRSIRFHCLYQKLRELCGCDAVSVRCQLPTEDMDALVSVTGDDDLASVLDEYDIAAARQEQDSPRQQLRVRVFLHPPAGTKMPRSPATPPRVNRRRPGDLLMHGTRAGSPHAGRFILTTPLAPGSPARPELFCQ